MSEPFTVLWDAFGLELHDENEHSYIVGLRDAELDASRPNLWNVSKIQIQQAYAPQDILMNVVRKLKERAVRVSGPTPGVKGKKRARMDLLAPEVIWEVAEVLGIAAEGKYAERNWERGLESGDLISAAMRHIFEWMGGKTEDEDTGKSPLAHAICVLMFARALEIRGGFTVDNRSTSVHLGSLRSELIDPNQLLDVN